MALEENLQNLQKIIYSRSENDLFLVSIQSLYERSLNIGEFKDFKSFKNIIDCALKKPLPVNYVDADFKILNEVCLDIASKNGLTKFVKILLREGAKVNRVNNTFNRAPIHFATEGGHVDTLEALLEEPTVNPNLSAGQQTALDIAVNNNNKKCVSLLLQKGASANIPSSGNLTAIHVAALNRNRDIVELIFENHWQCLDLDNRMYNQQTTREVIQQNLPELPISKNSYRDCFYSCHICDKNDLKYYLNINDETNFLKNMLNDEDTFSDMIEELLKIATQKDLREAVKGILDWLEKEKEDTKKFVEQAVPVAIENGHHAILRQLLNVVPDIDNDLILDACRQLKKLRNQTIDARSHISNWLKCMELMLDQEGVDIHKLIDDNSNTPLHYAAKSGCREAITLFLNRGSYIGHMNKFNIPPIAYIPENTLSSYFDDCIQMDEQTNECAIEFNYRCLMPYNISQKNDLGTRELEVFMYIAHNRKLKNLLKHPLLSSFLYLKRHMIRYILWMNFIVYVPFYLLLNGYILSMAYNSCPNENGTQLINNTPLESSFVQNICYNNYWIWRIAIIIFLLIFIFREFLQFVCCFWYYIKDFMNCLQIMLIVLTIVLLCGAGRQIGITVILLSTWEFIILISRWPMFSISIIIFRTVFYNFVRLFLPYIFLIVPFALVFHIFFKDSDDPNFSNLVFSIFKTIVMLTGEFDIDDIFASHTVWNRIVFVMFVFLMVIVLMNMLNGLAVSDTAEILSKTELIELIYQIELITYFENIAYAISEPIRRWPSKIPDLWKSFGSLLASGIFLFPHYLKNGTINFKIYDSLDSHNNNTIYSKFEKNEYCTIFKMDDNIIEQAKQIIFNKNQLSDNDRIMIALDKLQKALEITSDETEVLD